MRACHITNMSSIGLPTSEQVSEEDRVRITDAPGKSIGDGWSLFQSGKISVPQIIAIAQTQLALMKQAEHLIAPVDCSLFLSALYRTIGAGLLLQGRCHESLKHHQVAHIASLESGDLSSTIQSLLCKANGSASSAKFSRYEQAVYRIRRTGFARRISSR